MNENSELTNSILTTFVKLFLRFIVNSPAFGDPDIVSSILNILTLLPPRVSLEYAFELTLMYIKSDSTFETSCLPCFFSKLIG